MVPHTLTVTFVTVMVIIARNLVFWKYPLWQLFRYHRVNNVMLSCSPPSQRLSGFCLMPKQTQFAEWLTRNRLAARFTIRGLAKEAGLSHASISNYENVSGTPDIPKPESIRKLADALGSSMADKANLYQEGLIAAGHHSVSKIDQEESGDPILTITREAGYDPADIDETEKDELRRSLRAFTRTWLEEKRRQDNRDS